MQTNSPILLPGRLALSESRLTRLAQDIGANRLCAICVHYVDLFRPLKSNEKDALESLLAYGEVPNGDDQLAQQLISAVSSGASVKENNVLTFYVTPRSGTISPWSSQATAIAHVCGLSNAVRRVERGFVYAVIFDDGKASDSLKWKEKLFDRMTQEISSTAPTTLFTQSEPGLATSIPIITGESSSRELLQEANRDLGLGLEQSELSYLEDAFSHQLKRNPVDVEIFSYAQVNSEHCRHKQFNADWTIDGELKPMTLFEMIRNTYKEHPGHVISAYSDNAAVFEGAIGCHWAPNFSTGEWIQNKETVHYLGKVETHNHPTAVSPYPGAATGSGGEIRDEAAVGRGSKSKAGLSGYCVSDLLIPGHVQPWELDVGRPSHIASSLDIMLEAPVGSASFNNEYGRPCTTGFFRTMLMNCPAPGGETELRGYHKPIMIAGGIGSVRPQHALKDKTLVQPGNRLVVLGGPAMLIGLGGGAASSVQSGESSVELDFASVQRGNAEVQRRAQEVINACVSLGNENPILFIHDVGAGGLSNALPELVHDAGLGATFELREIDNADRSMSPLQIWCCEAQERYVLAVSDLGFNAFKKIANRERCGFSVVGKTTGNEGDGSNRLVLMDRESKQYPKPIDLPMSILFGKPAKMTKTVDSRKLVFPIFKKDLSTYVPQLSRDDILPEAVNRVLSLPAVGSKSFLITIGDRTVGGLTARDQMVGRWQVPVADVSVTATSLMQGSKTGEAMAMGEKPNLAMSSPAASARMAVAESLMNLAAADIMDRLSRVSLSANWMAASSHPGEAAALYEAVEAVGLDICPELGINIPVGKDSMSMKMKWRDQQSNENKEVIAPLSLVITAFSMVRDVGRSWTPALRRLEDVGETILLFVDLATGMKALGGSALCQCFAQVGSEVPDIRDVDLFKDFFDAIEQLHESGIVLAYHDRSDGGLFTTLVEMMFAGRCGIDVMLDHISLTKRTEDVIESLFNEELGAVFQVRKSDEIEFNRCFATCGPPPGLIKRIGRVPSTMKQNLTIYHGAELVYSNNRTDLQKRWSSTSYYMQRLRDDPSCADQEFENISDNSDPGLSYRLGFDPKESILPIKSTIFGALFAKPRVAILREQGVNGQAEMAFAFHSAGFSAVDVHMEDIISGRVSLASFVGLAACGGFSYGDVLGGGRGWAMSVLLHPKVREEFRTFFERNDTFTLGVCNGCQFLSRIREIIPGASSWPTFERNESEQFEARVCMVKVSDPPGEQPSVFFHGMHGSAFPIVAAHGEGRAKFTSVANASFLQDQGLVPLRYVDNRLRPTERYPFNPNGSPQGIAGVKTPDGRCLALMPHPERTILKGVASWIPKQQSEDWGDFGPWIRMFRSARRFIG